jgi:hypothetical protein
LDEFKEVVFQVYKWPWELICLLDVLKCDIVEVDEAMYQGVERTYKLIFCILDIQKSALDEVAEIIFQIGEWP